MIRFHRFVALTLSAIGAATFAQACSSNGAATTAEVDPANPGGGCGANCNGGNEVGQPNGPQEDKAAIDGKKNGDETDVDCGGKTSPKCAEGKDCLVDSDCEVACGYAKKCVAAPSCSVHLGGDTCGEGEVNELGANHESCCRSLPVPGFTDPAHPGKTVYLDKYEITAGRMRAFIEKLAAENNGIPDVQKWISANRPEIWDMAWEKFLPTGWDGPVHVIARRLLGDPRPEDHGWGGDPGPGVVLPPPTDQPRNFGVDYQFNSAIYVDLHGANCGVHAGTYGFPTFYYPPEVLARDGQLPRADGKTNGGQPIPAKDLLDVKAMNCVTNVMLAAFCAWDGGQLATDDVMDYIAATPANRGNVSGCGTQIDDHGLLLQNDYTGTIQSGGRCAPVAEINATFDAGDVLPKESTTLNVHNYAYPDTGYPAHDKSWQIAAPGRAMTAGPAKGKVVDLIKLEGAAEGWLDLHGNLNEAVLEMNGASFTGKFGIKFRGIGYGSSRSDLNVKPVLGEDRLRVQRPEAKAAYTGGRCMRFR